MARWPTPVQQPSSALVNTVRRYTELLKLTTAGDKMHDSDGIMRSVAPPQRDKIGVVSEVKDLWLLAYMWSMRRSNRTGGRACGVDMVIMAEILGLGRRAVATTPPIE